ncbi:hypothetical protein [Bdellovibrio sp. HCB337]|uniref:hypothetical protein n=1 Tax=Bdellovibrio sp. HCB337 TaxID=3394358 RepID=UPI0039A4E15A
MKLKMMIATAAMVLTSNFAMAQDESLIFQCESLPNVDSSLTVLGINDEHAGLQLVILINGEIKAVDSGTVDQNLTKFEGQTFELQLARSPSVLTAIAENPVLSVGQSDSLNCHSPLQ